MSNLAAKFKSSSTDAPEIEPFAVRALRFYSKLLTLAVFILIFVGSLVTSHDAGLAVPDWPSTYGQNMFLFPYSMWIGGIFYEHGHRLLASFIGLLTIGLCVWVFAIEKRRYMKILSLLALGAVILQGLLGGATVLLGLPDLVSVTHAVLAQSFFILTIVIAYFLSEEFRSPLKLNSSNQALFRSAIFCSILIYIQLIVGAMMRHAAAGLAIPDFPSMGGSLNPILSSTQIFMLNEFRYGIGLPPASDYQIYIHLAHRLLGIVITCAIFVLLLRALANKQIPRLLRRTAKFLCSVVIVQFSLGALSVLSLRAPYVASLHVACGALLLGLSVLFCLRVLNLQRAQIE